MSSKTQVLKVSVSMVTFNSSFDLVCKTVDALSHALKRASSRGIVLRSRLIVVDNSLDEVYRDRLNRLLEDSLLKEFDEAEIVHRGENLGYGAAHNLALELCDSDYHLVLNPDVELDPDALHVALQCMAGHPQVVVINPDAVNENGQRQYLCKRYPSVMVLLLRAFAPEFLKRRFSDYLHSYEMRDCVANPGETDVPLASGCCMFTRTPDLKAVGGFSTRYFLYFEDFDLSLRMAERGRVIYLPGMKIIHHGGHSARKGWQHIGMFVRSGWTFFRSHGWCWI